VGHTRKRNYDRYTLAYKLQAVKLANHPDVRSKDVAESLGIHPVMLYRWQMEHRRGELRENKHMKSSSHPRNVVPAERILRRKQRRSSRQLKSASKSSSESLKAETMRSIY